MSVQLNMEKAWFEKYRPRQLSDIVFPDADKESVIKTNLAQGYIQGNIIAYGPGGVGKTTISKVIQNEIINHQHDRKVLGRKVDDVDGLLAWLKQKPVASKQKLVIIEEIDRLSTQAMTVLKDGPLENYQPRISFIATTNAIDKIDPALLQRFNIKLNFNKVNAEGLYYRSLDILKAEGVIYNDADVWTFINSYKDKGIRNLINNLQIGSIGGEFNSQKVSDFFTSSGHEDEVIFDIKYFVYYLSNLSKESLYSLMFNISENPEIYKHYNNIIQIIENDFGFNYSKVMKDLINDNQFLVNLKVITSDFYQDLELKKSAKLHFLSMLNSFIKEIYEMKGGSTIIHIRN